MVLVWLCGVVGWLLLRPYRRITQLGGKDSSEAVSSAGSWHRRFFRDMRDAARLDVAEAGGTREPAIGEAAAPSTPTRATCGRRPGSRIRRTPREPARARTAADAAGRRTPAQTRPDGSESAHDEAPRRRRPQRRGRPGRHDRGVRPAWTEPDVPEQPASYAIYRPETGDHDPRAGHAADALRGQVIGDAAGARARPQPDPPLPAGAWRW